MWIYCGGNLNLITRIPKAKFELGGIFIEDNSINIFKKKNMSG